MRKFVCSLYMVILTVGAFATENPIHIVPEPAQVTPRKGFFLLTPSTRIFMKTGDSAYRKITSQFLNELRQISGFKLDIQSEKPEGIGSYFEIGLADGGVPKEGYLLDIAPEKITIRANDAAGLYYAFVSLRQLIGPDFFGVKRKVSKWQVPCTHILDFPRYAYRGMHLDVSRHFFSIDYLKKYLDILAFYKINTFHWHLTDSHGWRLEIKQYPKLTSVGAWRAERNMPMTIAPPTGVHEPATYGGFYTQEQVKELVKYAQERFITIIPEIEMPGHCTAALVAYPEFTCLNNPVPLLMPCGYPGDLQHNFCAGNDSTFKFLENVLDEVMELFPSEYIHIGGDEVKPASWLNCPLCQKRMRDENISSAKGLQSYFTKRIDRFITSRNRSLIGWDEIMEAGISANAAVMSWRGDAGGVAAAKSGHSVVMAPYRYVYFDFYQSPPSLEPNITYAGLSLDQVYSFEPAPAVLSAKQKMLILGAQACLWTENVKTPDQANYMLLPRLLALAEVVWTPAANKDYRKFIDKTEQQFRILDRKKINYAKSLYNVSIHPSFVKDKKALSFTLTDQTAGKHIIRFCTSGSAPSPSDPIYSGPVTVSENVHIKAALFDDDTMLGKISEDRLTIHPALAAEVTLADRMANPVNGLPSERLTDGIHGSIEPYDDRWFWFSDSVSVLVVDMGKKNVIGGIRFNMLEDHVANAWLPELLTISVSADSTRFEEVYRIQHDEQAVPQLRQIVRYTKSGINKTARFVKMEFKSAAGPSSGKSSPRHNFIDEIVVF